MTRDSTKKVREDLPGIIDERLETALSPIAAAIARMEAAMNTETGTRPAPPPPIWVRLGLENEQAWDVLPESVQETLSQSLDNEGDTATAPPAKVNKATPETEVTKVRKSMVPNSILKGFGPYQPIIYAGVDQGRRSIQFDNWVQSINRLINTKTGRVIEGARVVMKRDYFSIWNKEICSDNRFVWDTHANVAKAIAKTKAGTVTSADSWNATTRKRQFYRKLDVEGEERAGKYDGLIVEYYMPKTGDGWFRVVEYTNPVKKDFIYG